MHEPIGTITLMNDRIFRLRVLASIFFALWVLTCISHWGLDLRYEEDTNSLAQKIDKLYHENEALEKQLKQYEATEEYIKELGATEDQAKKIIKAGEAMNVNPKSLRS